MARIMKLSERLKGIANMVGQAQTAADIGTDHAFIPIHLIQNEICSRCIASDIRKGPVEKARRNIRLYGVQDRIEVRMGPGLITLEPGEADTIIISGMGGLLILDILMQGSDTARRARKIILQPMTHHAELRKWLLENGYRIDDEDLVEEGERIYLILEARACSGDNKEAIPIDRKYIFFGKALFDKKHHLLGKYIISSINELESIRRKLEGQGTSRSRKRLDEVSEKIELFKILLNQI